MTRITYTEDAAQDFEEIYRHIAEDNLGAAEKHRQNLKHRCESLLHQPRMGRTRDEVRTGWRSVTEGDYVILYRVVDENTLAIMRIIHGKRDLGKALKDSSD